MVVSGCMTAAPKWVDPRVYAEQAHVEIERRDAQVLELEAYKGRLRHRNRLVRPVQPGETELQLMELGAEAEIIDDQGYRNGLACLFINDSTVDLDVEVRDPRGQQFKFTLPQSMTLARKEQEVARVAKVLEKSDLNWEARLKELKGFLRDLSANQKELKLEVGRHTARAFRQRHDSKPWAETGVYVGSDKSFWPEKDPAITALHQVLADLGLTLEALERPGLLMAKLGLTPATAKELQELLAQMDGQLGYFGYGRFYGRSYSF